MRRAVLNVVADEEQRSDYIITRENHRQYATRCNAEYVVLEYGHQKTYDPAVKYLTNNVAAQFDQTLYLDTKCVITKHCPNIFDEVLVGTWGVVDELGISRFWSIEEDQTQQNANAICAMTGLPYVYLSRYINTNVMILPNNSSEYYFHTQAPMPVEYTSLDQLWLSINLQLHDVPLKELDRRFCWCWNHKRFFEDLEHALIVNFSGMPKRHDALMQFVQNHMN